MEWAFISLVLSLIFVSFAMNPLQNSIDEIARNNEKMMMQEIASGINLVEISPDGTTYNVQIPIKAKDSCTLDVKNGLVRVVMADGGKKTTIFSSYINSSTKVEPGSLNCLASSVTITKNGGSVRIS